MSSNLKKMRASYEELQKDLITVTTEQENGR